MFSFACLHITRTRIVSIILGAKRYASEALVCDDGSSDDTASVAKSTGAWPVIRGPVNKGYGFAIKSLFQLAIQKDADIVVTTDSDGQHNTDDIPSILQAIGGEGFT